MSYMIQEPFPHIVIDNYLDKKVADQLYRELLLLEPNDDWYNYDTPFEFKRATDKRQMMPPLTKAVMDFQNSQDILPIIEKYSGIKGLISDPYMRGGGIHMIMPGGFLDIHADRQIHPELGLYRRLNLLIYLNKDYKPEYGGQLELWERDMKSCRVSVDPIFNRAVLFGTDKTSYHGHPKPWSGPSPRKSLALYYWTASVPPELEINTESTDFKKRPDDPEDAEKDKMRIIRKKGRLASNV